MTSLSFICLRSLVLQRVKTTVAITKGRVECALATVECRRTVCARSDCNDNGQRPVKDESEKDERDDDIDKCGNDVEQDKLRAR